MHHNISYGLVAGILLVQLLGSQPIHSQSMDSIRTVKPGAALVQVSNQFKFTEGPAVDKQGVIYFTDQPNDKIWTYGTDGKLTVFMDKTGRSNGLFFDKKGTLYACADEQNEIWAISPKGNHTVVLSAVQGRKLNGPNDLWLDKKGGIYFTDPYYQRDYWTRKKPEMDGQKVYFLPNRKQEPIVVDGDLKQPNGIVGTPDGKYLYVADIGASKTYKYQISPDGTLTNRQLFVNQGSDGMTLDNQGNVYLTGRGVTIYDPAGTKIGTIPVPSRWVGNICFGGKDRNTLFITASESVYTLQMQVTGVE
ncbi:SMP-30/gluconolactonase/LRE family protein [Fibrella aquatilis]|uniref:SMP-30/gluconolactonase/LRE family protein n=1 Tax=Fibrella aquatilis TaxID=2817059 RepID=A0A939G281_9BACT|nr:SMP-30/gluconolactonase/LRE family protein [Fibrella aquatilis]MBO0929735.1 SMP-30/gluconolactonase/LRE family protein [Fibrella aquatilis]